MAQVIRLKRSVDPAKIPILDDIVIGELAINAKNGILYMRKGNGVINDTIISIKPEQGGIHWNATTNYNIGDVVLGTNDVLFRSLTGGLGKALPSTNEEDNIDWSSNVIFDPGTY